MLLTAQSQKKMEWKKHYFYLLNHKLMPHKKDIKQLWQMVKKVADQKKKINKKKISKKKAKITKIQKIKTKKNQTLTLMIM